MTHHIQENSDKIINRSLDRNVKGPGGEGRYVQTTVMPHNKFSVTMNRRFDNGAGKSLSWGDIIAVLMS